MIELKRPFAEDFVSKSMSDAELRRKKELQSKLAIATSTTGLSSLGLVTAGGIARKKPSVAADGAKAIFRSTKKFKPVGEKQIKSQKNADELATSLKDKGYAIGAVGSGIGGFGGFNFAAIQRAEAQRRRQGISKYYNAYTGTQTTHYSPRTSFASPDPEKRRKARAKVYTPALAAAGAGAIAGYKQIGRGTEKATVKTSNWSRKLDIRNAKAKLEEGKAKGPSSAAVASAKKKAVQARNNAALFARAGNKKAEKKATRQAKKYEAVRPADVKALDAAHRKAYSKPVSTAAPKALKRGKIGAIVGGTALLGLAAGNEIHRRHGGKPYKGHFDKYRR